MSNKSGKIFMHNTKYPFLDNADQSRGLPPPPLELPYDKEKPLIALPEPDDIVVKNIDVREAIEARTSNRSYTKIPLKIEELSYLLWCTQGVKEVIPAHATFRTVPSAGARHCFETYLLINHVEDIHCGIYRFLAIEHALTEIDTGKEVSDIVTKACFGQQFIKYSAVTFIWTAVAYRMTWRYGDRGFRYMHLDAGHVCQNLYLSAETVNCGVCAIAAFSDDDLNQLLQLDGVNHFALYIATVGKK